MLCYFVTDLHGNAGAVQILFELIKQENPAIVFIGGDLTAGGSFALAREDMLEDILAPGLRKLKADLQDHYPLICVIPGNDDPKSCVPVMQAMEKEGLWRYVNQRHITSGEYDIYGYAWVPPTPFLNKDWERYDVSRFVDLGCVSPEEGYHTRPFDPIQAASSTIQQDLDDLTRENDLAKAILLFHAPPYQTGLDRAPLDGMMVDYAPLDVHVGSIAIRRFIEDKQPLLTLHGHVHESYQLTGVWKERLGRTVCISAAGTGPALTLVRFSPAHPEAATRTEIL